MSLTLILIPSRLQFDDNRLVKRSEYIFKNEYSVAQKAVSFSSFDRKLCFICLFGIVCFNDPKLVQPEKLMY